MFLHPWAVALGAVAIGLPFAIHWLTKPRPVRMPLSTLRFVREAVRQRRAHHRLRDFVVLTLRSLAILLVALAVARPKFGEQPLVSDANGGSALRVVIMDVSQSMAAVQQNTAAIDRARILAAKHLRYRPGLRANLIFAGSQSRSVFSQLSQNFEALRDELQDATARPERLDINRAIAAAAEMMKVESDNDELRRELVIVSDFQRSNWARANFSVVPARTQIQFESTGIGQAPENLAILRAEFRGRARIGVPAQLEVEVGNYSSRPQQANVEVTVGDAAFRLSQNCPPGRKIILTQEISLQQSGWHTGEARLVGLEDALQEDNTRGIAVEFTHVPTYAILTRQLASQVPSSSYFIERALVPDSRLGGRASGRVVRINPGEMDREKLSTADVIVIDHPGKLDASELNLLAGLLRRGRPILYCTSESIDATNFKLLADAAGSGLQMPVAFVPPPRSDARKNLFLASVREEDAPFDVFGESSSTVVSRFRFAGGLNSRRLEDTLDDDVLATYSDGSACLVLTSSDVGTLAVLNADLARSSLPTGEAFVPLLDRLIERLLQRPASAAPAVSGEQLVVRLPANVGIASELTIEGPAKKVATQNPVQGELIDEGPGVVWRWSSPAPSGVYQMKRGEQTVFATTVTLPEDESPLESLASDVLENRLARGMSAQFRSGDSPNDELDSFWTWLLVACSVCMLGEFAALILFRS